jgi:hypothetical protein
VVTVPYPIGTEQSEAEPVVDRVMRHRWHVTLIVVLVIIVGALAVYLDLARVPIKYLWM